VGEAHPGSPQAGTALLHQGGIASAGKVNVIGLARIKERLGPKWDRVSEHVHRYFEVALERECKRGDIVRRLDELSYVVIFRDLDFLEAQIACAAVAEKVCRHLFGEEGQSVSVRTLVGQIDRQLIHSAEAWNHAVEAALESTGTESIVTDEAGNIAVDGPGSPRRRLTFAYGGEPACEIQAAPAELGFVYRPFWDPLRSVVLSYLCQPVLKSEKAAPYQAGLCTAASEDDQTSLDLLALRECVHRLANLQRDGMRILLAAPLHFGTLAFPRPWQSFSAAYRDLPSEIRRDLGFIVFGFDPGVPNIRLAQELPKVTKHARHVFCAVAGPPDNAAKFGHTGIQAVGMVIDPSPQPEQYAIERVRILAQYSARVGLDSFILGAQSASLIVNAVGSGVRYVEGPAVRLPVDDPRYAFVRTVEELYRPAAAG